MRRFRRIHDLLRDKYGTRMMMWGDIILQHPDHPDEIPQDTIMLTWGYAPRESFEDQIIPFAESGYEFFVCPGVNNWSRILPDFGVAETNIRHFVRDGAAHGEYMFSDGKTGPVGRQADGVPAQVKAQRVHWGIKYNADRVALGIGTPEVAALHVIAPGAGAGGVGIEASEPANHFFTFAGVLEDGPEATMQRLSRTLDFRSQPRVVVFSIQSRQ